MERKRGTEDPVLIRHAITIVIGAVTFVMLLMAVISWRQNEVSEEAQKRLSHTYEVIGHMGLLFSKLKYAEVGQRGFILTGHADYLEPYYAALKDGSTLETGQRSVQPHRSIHQELTLIRALTSDNPVQQSNLDEMDVTVTQLLAYLATSIQERKKQSVKPLGAKLEVLRGKEIMDHAGSLVRIMEAEEHHLLRIRMDEADHYAQRRNQLTLIAMIMFYVVIMLSIWLYQRSHERMRADMVGYTQELEQQHEELKQQREELQQQQEELKASNEEIEATAEEMEEKNKALEEQNVQIRQQSEELVESKRLIEGKAQELERASQYKSEFLANMSHELRTPLNSLLILSRMLAANQEGNLTAEQVEEARVIHNGGLELLGLINDVLDLSKVEAGKLTMVFEDVAVEDMVTRMQQQFAPVAKEKSLAFPIKVGEEVPKDLYTDAQRVEQILKNLLSNAFKFTEHGFVTLEIRRPNKREIQRSYERAIAFSVIDTGIGIEPSKFKDIFEAFQQEDGSIDRHYGGTGLGLTIARKFAHMLGGEIHVTSTKGEGSVFTLVLPEKQTRAETEDIPATPPEDVLAESDHAALKAMPKTVVAEFIADDRLHPNAKDKVLLIIEDDSNFAMTLMKIARKRGYKCLAAGDGKTGLVLAVEQPVTSIILDLTLPDIDGMRVLDQLKHDLRTRHIPVHIISGREGTETVVSLRKGAVGYLTKPVEQEAIDAAFTRIETLLHSEVKHVLVVEDDKATQVAIQALLKKKDIHLTLADTGQAGLNYAGERTFDCVILDLQLPDMLGTEWLEMIKSAWGETAPPVIIYTARELSEDDHRTLSRYTSSIIMKGAKSSERLLDEVTLFLHSVESTLSKDQQDMIRMQHNPNLVLQGRTLLLVDDDLRNTFALSKLLKQHGLNIVIADNGQMALDKLNEDRTIELVIMDIMMPVMDGYQAMREIRTQPSLKSVPVIALTARAMPEEQKKCMAAGANDYLTKPVDMERLLTLLRVWLFRQEAAV